MSESDAVLLRVRAAASRMKMRVDAIIERDGSVDAAITGKGVGIGYLLASEIVGALEAAADEIERLDQRCDALQDEMQEIGERS